MAQIQPDRDEKIVAPGGGCGISRAFFLLGL